ncbi:MAG: pseudouridine synthase [Bacteriovoracaceae bacterium]|nr:pseudouridine synthase [Bacteriovoracaceae bacterium]
MSRYILFHKPYDVLSQFTPEEAGQKTLGDFDLPKNIYPVGRLDRDSEGLLLLTDDADIQHRLTDPKFFHEKTYWVQVEGIPDQKSLDKLKSGVTIQDYKTRPCQAKILSPAPEIPARNPPIRERKSIPTTWLEIILTEGKNRQVRRMTASVGFPTLRLIRVAIGKIRLDDLELGKWREIKKADLL